MTALQMELCDSQGDGGVSSGIELLSPPPQRTKYTQLAAVCAKVLTWFGSTYVYEARFSMLNFVKSRHRN